MTQFQ